MSRSQLVVGLAAVFAGLTVSMTALGFAYSPVALAVAVAFGAVTYALWYHASGRLAARVRRQARAGRAARAESGVGGFGARARTARTGPRGGRGFGEGTRERRREPSRQPAEPTSAEAYRTLGLDPGAGEAAVRSAYRERVKEVHPDAESGDQREFKRVNEAYERLSE